MKVATCFLAIIASSLASPIEESIDWHHIKPLDLHVEPLVKTPKVPGLRIIGGHEATPHSLPYIAALIIDNSGFCGGSLISREVVLTAAHCVDSARQTQVILGAHSVNVDESTQRVYVSHNHIVHAQWNRILVRNDIALIRIPTVTLTHQIQLVPLAPASSSSFEGHKAVLAGWGRASDASQSIAPRLRRVDLQVIPNDVCRNTFGILVQSQHICTSGHGVVGACNGDSGGPLTVNGVEVGIVSFGNRQCEAQAPTVYARVSHFRNWIQQNGGV